MTLFAVLVVSVLAGWSAVLLALGHRRHLAEDEQALALATIRTVQQGIVEAIQVFSPEGLLVSRNPAADLIFEMESTETTREALMARWEFIGEGMSAMEVNERPLGMAMRTGVAAERVTVGIRKRSDSTVKWLSMSTFPIRGSDERILGYVSCAWDITETNTSNRELQVLSQASERLVSSLVPSEVVAVLLNAASTLCSSPAEPPRRALLFKVEGPLLVVEAEYDPSGTASGSPVTFPIAEHPYVGEVLTHHQAMVAKLRHEDCGPTVADAMRRQRLSNCAWVPLTRDGTIFAVLSVAGRQHGLVTPSQLQRLKTLAAMGELAINNAQAHERVAALALTDPLTGVGNRRALDERIAQLGRSRFALVAVDVDDLKKVNDAHGHRVGDELLIKVASALAAEVRPSDLLARVGGDEFIVLILDCDAEGAVELSRRLTLAASAVELGYGSPSISVGSAAGAAGATPTDIAGAADAALYAAKNARPLARVV
jgi:diguanylate cyclase (GGDEF)-like protein